MTDVDESEAQQSIFKWDTLKEIGPYTLFFKDPVKGQKLEVELISGFEIQVFRADDGQFYFCHGLTFSAKDAPGGAVSPFSGQDVQRILDNHYRLVDPESLAVPGDIVVWWGPGGETPHSAVLIDPIAAPGTKYLDYRSLLRSKNGKLPEATMTLERLIEGPGSYGESYNVYRRK